MIADNEFLHILRTSLVCNSTATQKSGNSTEQAIIKFYNKISNQPGGQGKPEDFLKLRERMVTKAMLKFPFTSSRKRMCTQVLSEAGNNRSYLLMKGASEKVVEACSNFHQWNGDIVPLSA